MFTEEVQACTVITVLLIQLVCRLQDDSQPDGNNTDTGAQTDKQPENIMLLASSKGWAKAKNNSAGISEQFQDTILTLDKSNQRS